MPEPDDEDVIQLNRLIEQHRLNKQRFIDQRHTKDDGIGPSVPNEQGSQEEEEDPREELWRRTRDKYGIPPFVADDLAQDMIVESNLGFTTPRLAEARKPAEQARRAERKHRRRVQWLAFLSVIVIVCIGGLIAKSDHNDGTGIVVMIVAIVIALWDGIKYRGHSLRFHAFCVRWRSSPRR